MVINDIDASDEQSQMQVINRLFAAYDAYDVEGMLSLHTGRVRFRQLCDRARAVTVLTVSGTSA